MLIYILNLGFQPYHNTNEEPPEFEFEKGDVQLVDGKFLIAPGATKDYRETAILPIHGCDLQGNPFSEITKEVLNRVDNDYLTKIVEKGNGAPVRITFNALDKGYFKKIAPYIRGSFFAELDLGWSIKFKKLVPKEKGEPLFNAFLENVPIKQINA